MPQQAYYCQVLGNGPSLLESPGEITFNWGVDGGKEYIRRIRSGFTAIPAHMRPKKTLKTASGAKRL